MPPDDGGSVGLARSGMVDAGLSKAAAAFSRHSANVPGSDSTPEMAPFTMVCPTVRPTSAGSDYGRHRGAVGIPARILPGLTCLKAAGLAFGQPVSSQTEHPMSKNEFYYLLLVCMTFGGLALSLGAASLRYRSQVRQGIRVKTRK